MSHGLHDLVRHNAWATARVLAYCQDLDEPTLNATVPGTYGSIIDILRHLIDSEASYVYRLTGAWPQHPWRGDGQTVGLNGLKERATILANTIEQFLANDWNNERLGEAHGDNGDVFAVPAGIFITQIIHHSNEHRAHICSILGASGFDPPDVSAWAYAWTTGRSTLTLQGADS